MKVYQTNAAGEFVGEVIADPDPMEAGRWLIPGGCVTEAPPEIPEGYLAVHSGGIWEIIPPPAPESPAPPPTIEEVRAHALAAMLARIETFTAQFTAGYPSAEIASWPTKSAEAAIILAGGSSAMIDAEAQARGKTSLEIATLIATNTAFYTTIIAIVSGVRGSTEVAIASATTPEEVDAALAMALATAQAAAASLGLTF
jgi:hypothetical protein